MDINYEFFEKAEKKLDSFKHMGLTAAGICFAAVPFTTQNAVTLPNLIMAGSAAILAVVASKSLIDQEKMEKTPGFNQYDSDNFAKEFYSQATDSKDNSVNHSISSLREKAFGKKDHKNKLDM